jgi:hypothetical protein
VIPQTHALDLHALDNLRSVFLDRMPDFGDFSDHVGTYWNVERAYKDAVSELVRAQLPRDLFSDTPAHNAEQIIKATRYALTGRIKAAGEDSPASQNIVGWRYGEFLRTLTASEKARFATALGDLLYTEDSEATRVGRFTDQVWDLYRRPTPGNNPYALSRIFPTFFLMFLKPQSNIAIHTTLFEIASKQLLGHSILVGEPLGTKAYAAVLSFAEAVFRQLESWAWCPRDMIDVHSFLWIVTHPAHNSAK